MSHLDSREAKLVEFLKTSIRIARDFIVLGKPSIANDLLDASTSATIHYADRYNIKLYNGGENFTILKRSDDDIIEKLRDVETVEMYLHESISIDWSDNKHIELSVVIDKTNGDFSYY